MSENQYHAPGWAGLVSTCSAASAAAWSCTAWSNRTAIGCPTPTFTPDGGSTNDGNALRSGVSGATVRPWCPGAGAAPGAAAPRGSTATLYEVA